MTEASIQTKIMKALELRGAIVFKTISLSKSGFPDIMGCYKGAFIFIEVKRPGQKATKLQEFKMNRLSLAGAIGVTASDVATANELLDAIDT